jgi:hypothetical protein
MRIAFFSALATALAFAGPVRAAAKAATAEAGLGGVTVLKQEADGKEWQLTTDKEELPAGTRIIGGLGASIVSAGGAVRATMLGDIAGLSPYPILETSLVLQEVKDAKDVDFAFAMDRGRVDLVNLKPAGLGAAKVRITVRGKTGEVVLPKQGDRVAVEIYGRWPRGVRFTKTPKETDAPAQVILVIAVKGDVELNTPNHSFALHAPPGPAMLSMDDVTDKEPQLYRLDQVPAWVDAKDDAKAAKMSAAGKKFRELAARRSVGEALEELASSDEPADRRLAVVLLGATDDLKRLGSVLALTKQPDVWDNGVIILRHWIGRGAGQDVKLYKALVTEAKYGEGEAALVLQLLHSFGESDLRRPETFQALIDLLDSDRRLVRGLAHWHLVRLVPKGDAIEFDINATPDQRTKALKAWRDLVPAGTIPGQPAPKDVLPKDQPKEKQP